MSIRWLPVSVCLEGEYGQRGIFASVPCILGGDGVEEIVQIEMTGEERALFDASCSVIRDYTERAASLWNSVGGFMICSQSMEMFVIMIKMLDTGGTA